MTTPQSIQSDINWSTVIFEAHATNEQLDNVIINTTKSEFLEQVRSVAYTQLLQGQKSFTYLDIDNLAKTLIDKNTFYISESVDITDRGIVVCLDVDVIDDNVIWTALDRIYEAIETGGKWQSAIPLSYTVDDLKFLFAITNE